MLSDVSSKSLGDNMDSYRLWISSPIERMSNKGAWVYVDDFWSIMIYKCLQIKGYKTFKTWQNSVKICRMSMRDRSSRKMKTGKKQRDDRSIHIRKLGLSSENKII